MNGMKTINIIILTSIIFISIGVIGIARIDEHDFCKNFFEKSIRYTINNSLIRNEHQIPSFDWDIMPHDPIYINGDDDFIESNGVIEGNGTKHDPYLIQGWNISCKKDDGIVIRNTKNYFIISKCFIHNGGENRNGIVFKNVQNGLIQNNTIYANKCGIFFATQLEGKENSEHNIIKNNEILFNIEGISFEHTLKGWHQHNKVSQNNISHNTVGMYMIMSENNTICYNNFILNDWIAIFIDQCRGGGEHNCVHHNNFIKNGMAEQASGFQVFDTGETNFWNESYPSGGNYWSDYEGIDYYSGVNQKNSGPDGIGDTPYMIRNRSLVKWLPLRNDSYPLMSPVGTIDIPLPPNKPMINCSPCAKENNLLQFKISSIDPNEDHVYFTINWGDQTGTEWLGPYNSDEIITFNHTWSNHGIYEITVKVKDDSSQAQQKIIIQTNKTIVIFPENVIITPTKGLYISNTKIFDFDLLFMPSIIFGNIDVHVEMKTDELSIQKVKYYLDNELQETVNSEPYIWLWDQPGFSRYQLQTKIFSAYGCNMSYQMVVWKFF